MTQAQYQWLKNNGYDPTVYDVDDQGNIFENPAEKKEVMSPLRAGLTSFAGNLLPTGGAMAASAPFMPLAVSAPPIGIPLMLGAGLLGGYGTGKLQQAGLERYAPEAIAEMQRAETDQPVASYLGGFAPNALTMRPSVKGLSGLLRPTAGPGTATLREALSKPGFLEPAINVGANVAGSTAGQLLDMSQGGEFSVPRFAADVALGSLFNKPTALGRKLGFTDSSENARTERPDLGASRNRPDLAPTQGGPEGGGEMLALNAPEEARQGRTLNQPLLNQPLSDLEVYLPAEGVGRKPQAVERPFIEVEPIERQNLIADKAEESLDRAFKQLEAPVDTATAQKQPAQAGLSEDARAAQDLLDEAKQSGNQENIDAAQEIYDGINKRFSRGEGASNSITQEDIDFAHEIADRRGLKIELERAFTEEGGQEVRGLFMTDKNGNRVMRINPFMATADTAIHEIGHDIFKGVTNKGMRRSLMDTALDSPAYKAELAARAEEVRAGKITQEQANDIALEEGLIQAFGEKMPQVNRGELRAWFAAFKANVKRIATGKMSPEDALDWMHYATTENVPWKGVAVAKGGGVMGSEERLQRAQQETPEFKTFFDKSQVVDAEGKPKFVYHGTGADISEFKKGLLDERALYGPGIYTTESKDVAGGEKSYSFKGLKSDDVTGEFGSDENLSMSEQIKQAKEQAVKEGFTADEIDGSIFVPNKDGGIDMYNEADSQPNVMPLYASIKNAFDIDAMPENWSAIAEKMDATATKLFGDKYLGIDFDRLERSESTQNIDGRSLYKALSRSFERNDLGKTYANEILKAMGYDGITHTGGLSGRYGSGEPHKVWIAFEPEQIKSALGNKGTFDTANPDIRYQRAQQETPAFKNWFGESKVVDADGKPLTVYHGTSKDVDFNSFKGNKNGIWFTPDTESASSYAMQNDSMDYKQIPGTWKMQQVNTASRVIPAYVSLKNPAIFEVWPDVIRYATNYKKALGDYFPQLKAQGHDGVIFGSGKDTVYVAFNPEQVKSATANRGTFDPLSKDIRYQRPTVGQAKEAVKAGLDKTLSEIDQITRRGGIYETVGRAMTRAYNTADAMLGKARSLGLTITKLNYADANKLRSHLYNEYKNQQLLTPAPEIAEAYKEWRTQAKPFWVAEANKAGFKIDAGKKGLRDRIESEFWFPGHKLSDEARDILASKVGTPEYQKLKDDYLRDAEANYLSQGKLMTEAQEKALVDFEEQRALNNKTFDPSAPANFAGARKPMGRPLPESWVEKDFRKTFESYNARSAKDYAAQQHFEKSPEVMAALGSKKFFNDQDIPANILQNTDVIAPDPSIQSVMREFSGQPLQMPGKTIRSFGAAASALALQTISRIGDVGGTVTKPLAYIGLGDYGAYMGGMAEKLSDWSKLKARSIESGLNNPNANQDFHQVIGMGQDAGKYMQKVLDGLGFITGSSKLESVARTLAQAQGEMIVSINKRKAATGDKDAVRFLDTLNNDWRTQSDMALAAQFGQMMQGTYDMRQLPAWFLEGGAAPYLTWSKWSMSQMNNFRKFAVEPAMQGNLKPLIAQVLVGMAGGGAIEQVQEWLSGKESKAVKWSELESWARQNEGTIGTDGGELLLQKFMIMAQKTGTFGFAGDLAMMPINALVGDTQSSVGVFPAAELFADGMKNVAGALTAIDKGEDVGLVLQRFGKNVIVGKTQMARVASTWIDEVFNEGSDNLRSADRRKARLFEELSGTGRSNGMFPVSYENLAEQKFERGSVTEDTGEEAFNLVSRARAEATSPEDYASRIRKLKTSQNQIMPSLERQPMKAARYLGFVEGAEPGKGSETLKRYYTRQNEDKYRKSLIEGMSGIR